MERNSSAKPEKEPFRLAGSMTLVEGDEVDLVEALERIRKEQAELFRTKLDSILTDD